jgi:hypothetical protein
MPKERTRATFKIVLPGLLAGGLCGAAVGLGFVRPAWGIGAAILVAILIGLSVRRARRRFDANLAAASSPGDV